MTVVNENFSLESPYRQNQMTNEKWKMMLVSLRGSPAHALAAELRGHPMIRLGVRLRCSFARSQESFEAAPLICLCQSVSLRD